MVSSSVRGSGGGRFGIARKRTGADLVLRVSRLSAKSAQHLISSIRFLTIGTSPMVARRVSHRLRIALNRVLTAGWGNSLRANGGAATQSAVAGGGAVGPFAHAPALHPAFYRAIHPVAVIRRVRALVAVFQDGDCPEEFPAVVRSVCPALPVEFPEA